MITAIVPHSYAKSTIDKSEKFQPIIKFDCRGVEPFDFDPRIGWRGEGPESGTVFNDIDLNEKEWADYDEKIKEAVEINGFEARFQHSHE